MLTNKTFLKDIKTFNTVNYKNFGDMVYNLMDLYNEYTSDTNQHDIVWSNNEDNLELMLIGLDSLDIVNRMHYGHYRKEDAFITYDGYGNIKTFHYDEALSMLDSSFIDWANEKGIDIYESVVIR